VYPVSRAYKCNIMSPSLGLQLPTHFACKTIQWLNFNEKVENTNYKNASGLAILFKFLTSLVLQ
jgi:hypothetical protein